MSMYAPQFDVTSLPMEKSLVGDTGAAHLPLIEATAEGVIPQNVCLAVAVEVPRPFCLPVRN